MCAPWGRKSKLGLPPAGAAKTQKWLCVLQVRWNTEMSVPTLGLQRAPHAEMGSWQFVITCLSVQHTDPAASNFSVVVGAA